jgi:hypothetical protein
LQLRVVEQLRALCVDDKLPLGIDTEASTLSSYGAGQSNFARGIQEQEHTFSNCVTLSAVPEGRPLAQDKLSSRTRTADSTFHAEGDAYGGHFSAKARRQQLNREHSPREDGAGAPRQVS